MGNNVVITDPDEVRVLARNLRSIVPLLEEQAKWLFTSMDTLGTSFECPAYDKVNEVARAILDTSKEAQEYFDRAGTCLEQYADKVAAGAVAPHVP